jgi:hypothetical protein
VAGQQYEHAELRQRDSFVPSGQRVQRDSDQQAGRGEHGRGKRGHIVMQPDVISSI